MTPRCSVVIPVHNWSSLTRQCLDTLFATPEAAELAEIVVVDDASSDGTAALLAGYDGRVRVVRHTTNTGFAQSCNDGAAAARGELLVFLNNDTIPQPGWLKALVEEADAHSEAAVIGSQLLYPNGTIQHAGVVVCQDRYPRHLYAGFPAHIAAIQQSRPFQIVTAACALFRRELFERLNGFDTAFRNGYEDVDLCLRLGALGHAVRYCHRSVLYHLESLSRATRTPEYEHNDRLYRERWADRVVPDDLGYYIADGLLSIRYPDYYPFELRVDPHLALVQTGEPMTVERLLASRAEQVFGLLRENIRLTSELRQAEHQADRRPKSGQ